jgi:uncharacterized metal-binding protein YceD (DUF177 family)
LKIQFSQIGSKPKRISFTAQCDELEIFRSSWLKPTLENYELNPETLMGEMELKQNANQAVRGQQEIDGKLKLELSPMLECVRCLSKCRSKLNSEFNGLFTSSKNNNAGEERELHELNLYECENEEVPWEEFVLDAIEDSVPSRFYCRSNCLGLCQSCGANKNTELCSCDSSDVTSAPFH